MIKNIVVPVDGSEHANRAVALACEIAAKYEARVNFIHLLLHHASISELRAICEELGAPDGLIRKLDIVENSMVYTSPIGYVPVQTMVPPEILKDVGDLIVGAAKKTAGTMSVENVTTQVADGSPADRINEAAKSVGADLIVMGRRGLGNVAGILMGSVSHKVSNLADCACVTVK